MERLNGAMRRLPERLRRIIELTQWSGLSHAEAAAELGCSERAARALLYRAKARLAALMTAKEAEQPR